MARQYVGIDLHRRRSVIVHKNEEGEVLSVRRIDNDPINLAAAVADAGEQPEVILEATYGWYWAADLLDELGCNLHLAAPSSLNWGQRRVKNDERDANDLIDLFRLGRMTEAWIAPPAIQVIEGVGPVIAAVFVAEIGDVHRFKSPQALCSWAGLTPKHRESDTKVMRGKITKQGSRIVRWAAIEAISKQRGGAKLRADYHAITERRGKQKARVAVARRLLTLVYYGLRDH